MGLDGTREDNLLEVLALEHQGLGRVLVGDADDVLLDDGTGVELCGDVVARGADDLHAALIGLMVGLGADEGGQEGVVDVDDVVGIGGNHVVADDLHVAGQDDEGDAVVAQELHLGLLYLALVGPVLVDGEDVVRQAELVGHVAQVLVVGDDAGNLDVELTGLPARQQVVEAMGHLADEDGHAGTLAGELKHELHLVALGVERGDVLGDLLLGDEETLEVPLHTHEEAVVDLVHALVQVENVAVVVGDKLGDLHDDAHLVGAMEQKYGSRFLHRWLV